MCVCARVFSELKIGKQLNEGKTKQIFELLDQPGLVLVQSKDQITAGNAVRNDQMEGKAAIANRTTSCVFKLLQESGEESVQSGSIQTILGLSGSMSHSPSGHRLRNSHYLFCWWNEAREVIYSFIFLISIYCRISVFLLHITHHSRLVWDI